MFIYDTDNGRKYALFKYDCVLRVNLPKGSRMIGFSNDIALVIRRKHLVRMSNTRSCIADYKADVLLK